MKKRVTKDSADFIVPLNMNGLQGRMLMLPAPSNKQKNILLVYGLHSNIERWYGLTEVLNRYGSVTAPDMPGFGGMESFYHIHEKPTVDTLADYLAAFVKLRYKRRKVSIVGVDFGFVVVTRMLQRYPDLHKRIDNLVSIGGFARGDDFELTPVRQRLYRWMARLTSMWLPAWLLKHSGLQPFMLRFMYQNSEHTPEKADNNKAADTTEIIDAKIKLWQQNDIRTQASSIANSLKLDNCQVRVDLPVWHISGPIDRYLNQQRVEQHLHVIFSDVHDQKTETDAEAFSMMADSKQAASLLPPTLRRALAKP